MIATKRFRVQTKGHTNVIDITSQIAEEVGSEGVALGLVTVFVSGSTAAVTTIEYEPGLIADIKGFWQRLIPEGVPYEHDRAWGDGNGFSHLRSSLLGPSLVVPVVDGKLALGTWQQIVLIDFDNRPRSREVIVQIMGE